MSRRKKTKMPESNWIAAEESVCRRLLAAGFQLQTKLDVGTNYLLPGTDVRCRVGERRVQFYRAIGQSIDVIEECFTVNMRAIKQRLKSLTGVINPRSSDRM